MGMRSAVFDRWAMEKMDAMPDAVVLHLGCGMDSRAIRAGDGTHLWFDVDFPEVIQERKRYFAESETYHMIASDIREEGWWKKIPSGKTAIVVMEGISMYLHQQELKAVLKRLKGHFGDLRILMDSYTLFGAKASQYKNPIHTVGVNQVYGLEDPRELEADTGLAFLREHAMTPDWLIDQLPGKEQWIFRKLFAGRMAKKIYRMYEFR
jgi:O-methyltransferase involved in polyketide biosynthesis